MKKKQWRSEASKRQQAAARRAWAKNHPERKRIHEGRGIVLQNPAAPSGLVKLERTIMKLTAAISRGYREASAA
jgi:hypothetical protein